VESFISKKDNKKDYTKLLNIPFSKLVSCVWTFYINDSKGDYVDLEGSL